MSQEVTSTPSSPSLPRRAMRKALAAPRATVVRLMENLIARGLPPAFVGYRRVRKIPLAEPIGRRGAFLQGPEIIHPEDVADNPLPINISDQSELPDDAGWWTFSFRDVPKRRSHPTLKTTVPNALVVPCANAEGEFWVSILDQSGASLELREISFRPWQAATIRRTPRRRIKRATWILERVYDNHSHWLTAHLPKILLLKERGGLHDTLWPMELPRGVAESLQLYGIDISKCPRFAPDELLEVEKLTLFSTDRFRPELLRKVRQHCPFSAAGIPGRRIYISRSRAKRRRLLNEDAIWPKFAEAGFECVQMETLGFEEQVRLMRDTAILAAPHGAGLTNMIFCPRGTHVIEIADLSFPNPNFYALACAMDLPYWLVCADGVGDEHPLFRDMRVDPQKVDRVLRQATTSGISAR